MKTTVYNKTTIGTQMTTIGTQTTTTVYNNKTTIGTQRHCNHNKLSMIALNIHRMSANITLITDKA